MAEVAPEHAKLVDTAQAVRRRAYAPYSGYSVGCALLDDAGEVQVGVNVENVAFGSTICAERSAVCAMATSGGRKISCLAVATEDGGNPCGACLQVIREFAASTTPIILVDARGSAKVTNLGELLPHSFTGQAVKRTLGPA